LWQIIGQIVARDRGSLHFNALAGVTPEDRTIVSSFVWTKKPEREGRTDGRTDRQICRGYYSCLHSVMIIHRCFTAVAFPRATLVSCVKFSDFLNNFKSTKLNQIYLQQTKVEYNKDKNNTTG